IFCGWDNIQDILSPHKFLFVFVLELATYFLTAHFSAQIEKDTDELGKLRHNFNEQIKPYRLDFILCCMHY
ncbi:hypothetical protein ACJX0J_026700, partial [Zea mays]